MTIVAPAFAASSVKDACKTEIRTVLAAEYVARIREKIRMCLIANLEKVSEQCRVVVDALMASFTQN